MSYFGTVKDNDGKEYSVSISLSEIVNPTPAEEKPAQDVEDGKAEAQEMPVEGASS